MARSAAAVVCSIVLTSMWAPPAAFAQERSLEDVKREITRRAATRTPPFDHVRATADKPHLPRVVQGSLGW